MMKTFLLLAISSVVTAGVLPSLPAKIILSALEREEAPLLRLFRLVDLAGLVHPGEPFLLDLVLVGKDTHVIISRPIAKGEIV